MAHFSRAVLTDAGVQIARRMMDDELLHLSFTGIASGDGTYTGDEDLKPKTALKSQKQRFGLSSKSASADNVMHLRYILSNVNPDLTPLTTGYYVREIGIYAQLDDEAEALYAIAVADDETADYLPAYDTLRPSTITMDWFVTVGNTANISIEASPAAYALASDLEALEDVVDGKAGYLEFSGTYEDFVTAIGNLSPGKTYTISVSGEVATRLTGSSFLAAGTICREGSAYSNRYSLSNGSYAYYGIINLDGTASYSQVLDTTGYLSRCRLGGLTPYEGEDFPELEITDTMSVAVGKINDAHTRLNSKIDNLGATGVHNTNLGYVYLSYDNLADIITFARTLVNGKSYTATFNVNTCRVLFGAEFVASGVVAKTNGSGIFRFFVASASGGSVNRAYAGAIDLANSTVTINKLVSEAYINANYAPILKYGIAASASKSFEVVSNSYIKIETFSADTSKMKAVHVMVDSGGYGHVREIGGANNVTITVEGQWADAETHLSGAVIKVTNATTGHSLGAVLTVYSGGLNG